MKGRVIKRTLERKEKRTRSSTREREREKHNRLIECKRRKMKVTKNDEIEKEIVGKE